MADGVGRRGGRCVPKRMGGRADGRTGTDNAASQTSRRGGRGGKAVDGWADGGGKGADSGAKGRTGPTRREHADGAQEARTGPSTCRRADGRTSGQAVGRTGGLGGRGLHCADGRTGGRAGGPGFKRPHSTRPTSLLGTQSACLVRARVRRVLGSAVGSTTVPRQTPVLSARTHLPCLSANVLGVEKGILLFNPKNGFTQGRWQRDAKSTASSECTKG